MSAASLAWPLADQSRSKRPLNALNNPEGFDASGLREFPTQRSHRALERKWPLCWSSGWLGRSFQL